MNMNRKTIEQFQQEFRLLLQTDIVTFHYRKKNGKLRKAVGTTCLDFVPTDLLPKGIGAQRPEGYVNYYDLTVCGWRTLRLKYVTSYQIPTPEPCPPSQMGICSPLWGRSHAGGCSEDPSRPRGVEEEHPAVGADPRVCPNNGHPATQADEGNHNYQLSARPEGALSERSGERTINYQLCKP